MSESRAVEFARTGMRIRSQTAGRIAHSPDQIEKVTQDRQQYPPARRAVMPN